MIEKTITESLVNDFAKISEDYNPIHMDNEYAKTTKFKKRICHGMLLGAFISQYINKKYPKSIYVSQSLSFHHPCYIGDRIKISSTELETKENKISIRTFITKNDEILVDGMAKISIRE